MLMLGLFVAFGILNGYEVKAAPQKIDDDGYEISRTFDGGSAGAVHWYCYDAPSGQRATIGVKLVIKPEIPYPNHPKPFNVDIDEAIKFHNRIAESASIQIYNRVKKIIKVK